jgi:hypothetical protein
MFIQAEEGAMWFLTISCVLIVLAGIGTNMLLQRGERRLQTGFMKLLLRVLHLLFGCHHRKLSRVFTIKKRTYQVCLQCGQQFEYSWELMHSLQSTVAANVYAPRKSANDVEVPVV